MSDKAFVASEILDDVFGYNDFHERLADDLVKAYRVAMSRYPEYGYTDEEADDFALQEVSNRIWMWYSGGDTCYAAGRRIIEAWKHAGLLN